MKNKRTAIKIPLLRDFPMPSDYVCFKPQSIAFLASNFDISAVYGRIGLCFGYDAPVGLCYHISRAHAPITRFRGPWGPLK